MREMSPVELYYVKKRVFIAKLIQNNKNTIEIP